MKVKHESIIHGKCPINGRWDYYEVLIETDDFLEISEMEEILDFARGCNKTQEVIAKEIALSLPYHCTITLTGRHSQNTKTTTTASGTLDK